MRNFSTARALRLARTPAALQKPLTDGMLGRSTLAGRVLPRDKVDDPNWRALFLVEPPPDDLYIARKLVMPVAQRAKLSGSFFERFMKRAEATMRDVLNEKPKRATAAAGPAVVAEAADGSAAAVEPHKMFLSGDQEADEVFGWDSVSPDTEADMVGLEDLQRGQSLAIVGAGVSGLVLAWVLQRARPDLHIHIFERDDRVGGWMRSNEVAPGVLFESGPRTLLPSHVGTRVLGEILAELGSDQLVGVPRASPTNTKGLVYNGKIVELPSGFRGALKFLTSHPMLAGLRGALLREPRRPRRDRAIDDESVADFITRRFGAGFNTRFVSAIMRGIYAGDSAKLSARSVARFNKLYYLERTQDVGILSSALTGAMSYLEKYSKTVYPLLYAALVAPTGKPPVGASVDSTKYSLMGLKDGIEALPRALAADLESKRNVHFHLDSEVRDMRLGQDKVVLDVHKDGESRPFDANTVVATQARPSMVQDAQLKKLLGSINYANLAVVNVHTPEPVAKDWFGVLVPKSEDAWNTDGLLGVVFDSSVRRAAGADAAPGSTMTVMLGGDLWDPAAPPTAAEAAESALNGLEALLGPFDRSRATTAVTLQTDSIPQYEVGHSERVQAIHSRAAAAFGNRLAFAGMATGRGVGVSDCVLDAVLLAARFTPQRRLLHPRFYFGELLSLRRPTQFA